MMTAIATEGKLTRTVPFSFEIQKQFRSVVYRGPN